MKGRASARTFDGLIDFYERVGSASSVTGGREIMGSGIGRKHWAMADGYIPAWSSGPEPEMQSHESLSILNAGDLEAHVEAMMFFAERDPVGPYRLVVPARRTRHIRLNDLDNPAPIPRGVGYSCVIQSDVPVVIQHTRLDSRQAKNALVTTIAFYE